MTRRSSKSPPSSSPRPPRVASTRDVVIRVRMRERELVAYKERANAADVTLSEWFRARLELADRLEADANEIETTS